MTPELARATSDPLAIPGRLTCPFQVLCIKTRLLRFQKAPAL